MSDTVYISISVIVLLVAAITIYLQEAQIKKLKKEIKRLKSKKQGNDITPI